MNNFWEIEKLWNEFRKIPFPKNLTATGKEIDLITLDSFAAGCIDTFVNNKGSLDDDRIIILENCRKDLYFAIDYLENDAKAYFEQLSTLADKIIRVKK